MSTTRRKKEEGISQAYCVQSKRKATNESLAGTWGGIHLNLSFRKHSRHSFSVIVEDQLSTRHFSSSGLITRHYQMYAITSEFDITASCVHVRPIWSGIANLITIRYEHTSRGQLRDGRVLGEVNAITLTEVEIVETGKLVAA